MATHAEVRHAVDEFLRNNRARAEHAVLVLTAASIAYYFSQLRSGMTGSVPSADISLLMSGRAPTIYQYRALLPWIVNLVQATSTALSPQTEFAPASVFQTVEFLSIFALVLIFRHYLSLFIRNSALCSVLSITMFSALLFNFVLPCPSPLAFVFWYPWDIPSVMFFTFGLALLYRRDWRSYYILFCIATLNRETTAFLTIVYIITEFGRSSTRTIGLHCMAQIAIWVGLKYVLYLAYGDNPMIEAQERLLPGGFIDYQQWSWNILAIKDYRSYPFLISSIGFATVPTLLLWRMIPDEFVKRSLLVIIPLIPASMFIGTIVELRIFGELVPIILIAFLSIIGESLRRETVA